MRNRCVLLRNRPHGIAQREDFEIVERTVEAPRQGEILVRNAFLSVEPAMRGWIADAGNYAEPVSIGSVMRSLAVGEVVESGDPCVAVGELVVGWFGWQLFATVPASAIVRTIAERDLPISTFLGVLGINGVTALLALRTIGKPMAGNTVVVSTGAGGVGSAVGQLAKLANCRTVAITGSPGKVERCLHEFGYDAAIDYHAHDFEQQLDNDCPDGVDVYFDNTAGSISDSVLSRLAIGARVVVCGTAAVADWSKWPTGPRVERHLLVKRASMSGFVVFDHADKYDAAIKELADLVRSGRLIYRESILHGLEACPDAIAGLYRGENDGKLIISLASD